MDDLHLVQLFICGILTPGQLLLSLPSPKETIADPLP